MSSGEGFGERHLEIELEMEKIGLALLKQLPQLPIDPCMEEDDHLVAGGFQGIDLGLRFTKSICSF